jgi:hypothetical protein
MKNILLIITVLLLASCTSTGISGSGGSAGGNVGIGTGISF